MILFAHAKKTFALPIFTLTATAGEYLAPIAYYYPAAKALLLTRWPDAFGGFNCFLTGVGFEASRGPLTIRYSNFGTTLSAASISYKGLALYYEERVGRGLVYQVALHRLVNPVLGYSRWQKSGQESYFMQNISRVTKRLYLIAEYDWGKEESSICGATYQYAVNSFIKIYYDTKGRDQIRTEVTFTF